MARAPSKRVKLNLAALDQLQFAVAVGMGYLAEGIIEAAAGKVPDDPSTPSSIRKTEGWVILNGSRNINFTMELVVKDVGLFQAVAERAGVPLELSPVLLKIFQDGMARYGAREWSPNIIRRLEDATGLEILAPGFPPEMVDDEPEAPGYEVIPTGLNAASRCNTPANPTINAVANSRPMFHDKPWIAM